MRAIDFEHPLYFILLVIPFLMIAWYILRQRRQEAVLQVSTIQNIRTNPITARKVLRHVLFAGRVLAISFLITVLAGPHVKNSWKKITTEGIDIVLAIDISSSMLSRDFQPDRLEASKAVAMDFITDRPNDRIGLVVFSGESFTQCPLTLDHKVLLNLVQQVKSGVIKDGTAIGQGLANAVNRLKESKSPSKIVILLTDGVNNRGVIAPVSAARIAEEFGIRVYTIGVGSKGKAPSPAYDQFGRKTYVMTDVKIDEKVLQDIAGMTGGKYFRATDNQKLKEIYDEINQLEKMKMEEKEINEKESMYFWFAFVALLFVALELLLKYTILKSVP